MSDKIILEIIKYSGLSGALIALLISGLWAIYFNRIKEGQKTEFQKQLESLKSKNEKLNYITKTQFDAEFKIYQELSEASFLMLLDVSHLFPYGLDTVPEDDNERKKMLQERFKKASESMLEYQNMLFKYAPFIPENLYLIFDELRKDGQIQINFFPDYRYNVKVERISQKEETECYRRTKKMFDEHEQIIKDLRAYLSLIKVQDEK